MRFRKPLKITSRTSAASNSFVQAIIPSCEPPVGLRDEALAALGMCWDNIRCVYCGGEASDWDHLRPLVKNARPTGYLHEVRNLVPACGRCNQSKSGQDWRAWMMGGAKNSPASRGIQDLEEKAAALDRFAAWGDHRPVDLATLIEPQLWNGYWARLNEIKQKMHEAQSIAETIRIAIAKAPSEMEINLSSAQILP